MSRQADTLFCKIAITAGMVTQQQAQKVLAFIDKREQETGRRPLIAAVFTKYNILTAQQTQQLKAAVAKRMGQAAPVPGRVQPGGRGKRGRRRERVKRRPVDQQTLIMGAGFGVVFVGVLITICYLFLVGGGSEVSSDGSSQTTPRSSSTARSGTTDREIETLSAPEEKELPRETVQDINNRLSDILLDRIDNPARARSSLEKVKQFIAERRGQGYIIPANIEIRLRDTEQGLADVPVGDSPAVEESPIETPVETPVEEPTPEEPSEKTPAKTDAGDDIDLDDLEDLDDF